MWTNKDELKKRAASFSLVVLCLFINFKSPAQDQLTLNEAIRIGLKNNFDILMAKNREDAAALNYQYAYGAFLPTLSGSASRTWSNVHVNQKYSSGNNVERKNSNSSNTALSADLNWTLFDGLKVFATKDKLKAIQQLGALNVKDQVVHSLANIIDAYYTIILQKRELEAITEQMSISRERVKIANNKLLSGLGSKIDYLQAKVDLNAQKADSLRQQVNIDESKATLNRLILLPEEQQYQVEDTIPLEMNLNYEKIKQTALDQNFGLLSAKKNIEVSRLSLKEINRSRFPVINFNSSYSYSKQNSQAGFFLFNQSNGFNYGFSADVPIFRGFDINRQEKSTRLDIAYQQLDLQNQKSEVSLEVRNAYKDYSYYKEAMNLELENLEVAKENVQVSLAAFRLGQISSIEVKEAQQSLADSRIRLITARYNAKQAETKLLRLKGDLLK